MPKPIYILLKALYVAIAIGVTVSSSIVPTSTLANEYIP